MAKLFESIGGQAPLKRCENASKNETNSIDCKKGQEYD